MHYQRPPHGTEKMIEWWWCYPRSAGVTLLSHLSHLDQRVNSCQVNAPCAVVLGLRSGNPSQKKWHSFYIHLHVEVEGFDTHLSHLFVSVMYGWLPCISWACRWLKLILWHWTSTDGKDWLREDPVSASVYVHSHQLWGSCSQFTLTWC